ncbi:hypothetical protein CPB97_008141 [Podila verticillata]|nr:hypothetical protein CPB97_008141 [Podila verticillata]
MPPEILETVFSYIARSDLAKCIQVFVSLTKNARYVRELGLCEESILSYLFGRKERNRSYFNARGPYPQRDVHCLDGYVQASHLVLAGQQLLARGQGPGLALLKNSLQLATLDIVGYHVRHFTILGREGSEVLPESIRKVHLYVKERLGYQLSDCEAYKSLREEYDTAPRTTCSHPHLESLRINGDFKDKAEEVLLLFLSTSTTKLESFSFPNMNCFKSKSLAAALNRIGLLFEEFGPCPLPVWDEDSMLYGDVLNTSDSEICFNHRSTSSTL